MLLSNNLPHKLKIAIIYSREKKCVNTFNFFKDNINLYSPEEADILLCLGGDGFMLHTLHNCIDLNKPIYGINCGSLGFLMNDFNLDTTTIDELITSLQTCVTSVKTYPLEVKFTTNSGEEITSLAFNEASLLRSDGVAAHLKIYIDGELKCNKLVSDGTLVATPFGSLAYNKACGGPIIPLNSKLLILTAINAFDPVNFKGVILPESSTVTIEVQSSTTRKVNLFCDFIKYKHITKLEVKKSRSKSINILFNKQNYLTQKIFNAQFMR